MFTAISEGSLCAAIAMQKARRQETVAMRVIETPRFGIVARISRFWRPRDQLTKSGVIAHNQSLDSWQLTGKSRKLTHYPPPRNRTNRGRARTQSSLTGTERLLSRPLCPCCTDGAAHGGQSAPRDRRHELDLHQARHRDFLFFRQQIG